MPFRLFLLLAACTLLLSSCQDHKPGIDTFGELDSTKVASDTTMQVNMDRSYEYQKTLVQNDTLVYDFLAYDKPKGASSPEWESKFIVIRRSTHEYDTIIKDPRSGKVKSVMLSDMDHNGKPEILLYTKTDKEMKKAQDFALYAYETDGRSKAKKLSGGIVSELTQYGQEDSFFVASDFLIRKVTYRQQEADTTQQQLWQSYSLNNGKLMLAKERRVVQ